MILLSNGGDHIRRGEKSADVISVGTVDGVARLKRTSNGWSMLPRALPGVFVSALTTTADGHLFAATHGSGVARSLDGGATWSWPNVGIDHLDMWSIRAGQLCGRDVVVAGTQPAHLYLTEDGGEHWRELQAFNQMPTRSQWYFPPPPRIGHVKDIVIDSGRLFAGVEIGALAVSSDAGKSFRELALDPDPRECDVHRILLHPARPQRIIVTNGLMGVVRSDDEGNTWARLPLPPKSNYPDAAVLHPDDPDVLFMTMGVGWPPHWYQSGRARGKIVRSRDGGKTWHRLLGGLPDGQRALFSAISIDAWPGGYAIYAADTDGQVFESLDGGDHWTIVADVAPVSKGEFYRGLVKDRSEIATVDDVVVDDVAAARFAEANV
jgi:hypothetical protein